jgi:hypothetical protein
LIVTELPRIDFLESISEAQLLATAVLGAGHFQRLKGDNCDLIRKALFHSTTLVPDSHLDDSLIINKISRLT